MDQDGLSLFDYKSYISNSSEKFRRAYIDFFVAIAGLLGGGNNAQTIADNVWQLEKAIAEVCVHLYDGTKLLNVNSCKK
jgi:hypothetical protein